MIPSEVEDRIANYYFQRYLTEKVMIKFEEELLSFYLEDEEPSADQMVKLALIIIDHALKK